VDSLTPNMEALPVQPPPEPAPPKQRGGAEENGMPPGLEEFLRDHGKRLKINKRERYYLEQSRFRAEPWLAFDSFFWEEMLAFWRTVLKHQEQD